MHCEFLVGSDFSSNVEACVWGITREQWRPSRVRLVRRPTFFTKPLPRWPVTAETDRLPSHLRNRLQYLSHHNGDEAWQVIFEVLVLFFVRGAKSLADLGHPTIEAAQKLSQDLNYECHKLKAYLRFENYGDVSSPIYRGFHNCEHNVLPLVAPFFIDRFHSMRWRILTKWCSAEWDGKNLSWTAGTPDAPARDEPMDELWSDFYRSTFNPDRVNIRLFKQHVPRKYWNEMPEIASVSGLLDQQNRPTGADRQPMREFDNLEDLRSELSRCSRCELAQHASQAVKGEGPKHTEVMVVGEQPGDLEDKTGKPFVGPAGVLLRNLAMQAGADLDKCYLTNAVKHFRFESVNKVRVHKRASARQLSVCRSWLGQEIRLIKPKLIVCLGVTAAKAVIGYPVRLQDSLGKMIEHSSGARVIVTFHPASILRTPSEENRIFQTAQVLMALATIPGANSTAAGAQNT